MRNGTQRVLQAGLPFGGSRVFLSLSGLPDLCCCDPAPRPQGGRQSQDFRPRRDSTAHSASPRDGEREGGGHPLSFYRPVSDNGVGRFSTPLFNSYFLELLLGARHYVGC